MKLRKIDWTNHLIELFVVFISVTLAFSLNRCEENRKNRSLERQYLGSFLSDLQKDAAALDTLVKSLEQAEKRTGNLVQAFRNAGKAHPDSAKNGLVTMLELHPFYPEMSTYRSITNTGNLNLVSDFARKDAIVQYYQLTEQKIIVEEYMRLHINEQVIPFVYQQVDLIRFEVPDPEIFYSIRFRNLVLGYYALAGQNLNFYRKWLEKCRLLTGLLREKLRE